MQHNNLNESSTLSSWQKLDSKNLLSSKWFSVRRDTCKLPSGKVIDDYFVIEIPDGVAIVAVTSNKEIVLVRQYKHGLERIVLELPAGNVDSNENPQEAIRRELREETGYTASNVEYVATIVSKPARMSARTLIYFASEAIHSGNPEENDQESVETLLVPLEELSRLILQGAIVTETSLAALLMAWDRLLKIQHG